MKERMKQYAVFGLGLFGESLARSLYEMGHEVLAVDSEAELVEAVAPFVTQAVQLDATEESALETLGIRNFDAAIVSIGHNTRDSILVCVLLKEMGIPYLVAKAMDDLHAKVLRKVGVDRVVFPERDMGKRVARTLALPNVVELMNLTEEHQLVEIVVPKKWIGHSIREIDVRRRFGVSIVAIQRKGQLLPSPPADTVFEQEDLLLALGNKKETDHIDTLDQ